MTESNRRMTWLWDLWLLIVFIGFAPAMVLINNPESPRPWTALLIVGILVGLAVLVRLALVRFLGLDGQGVTYALALGGFLFLNTGLLLDTLPRWAVLAMALGAAAVAYRLRAFRPFEFIVTWACLGLTLGPLVILVQNTFAGSDPIVIDETEQVPPFTTKPDVVLVVADGYGSNEVLEEFYGYDNGPFTAQLADLDMPVNPGMHSNYARTKFSVASMLDMGYLPVGEEASFSFESGLVGILGGNNRIAELMRANGYRSVYFESGWLGTRCGEQVDVCVPGPWPDETFYDVVFRSALRDLPGLEYGMAFARGAADNLRNLDTHLGPYLSNGVPDFIYLHLLAPHPPFFLTATCDLEPSIEMSGFAVGVPGQSDAQRLRRNTGYVNQIECVNQHLAQAANRIDESEAVGLFFGDHGPDQAAQLFTYADQWTEEQKRERLGILFAAHHSGCDYRSVTSLVNVGRRLVACLSGSSLPDLPDRFFDVDRRSTPPTIIELDPPTDVSQ
jgi:hypothetical protein